MCNVQLQEAREGGARGRKVGTKRDDRERILFFLPSDGFLDFGCHLLVGAGTQVELEGLRRLEMRGRVLVFEVTCLWDTVFI